MGINRRRTGRRKVAAPALKPDAKVGPNEVKGKQASDAVQSVWTNFQQTHSARAKFDKEAVYALPIGLIDAIVQDVPGLLGQEDELFERQLTELSGLGFAFGRPIMFSPLATLQGATTTLPSAAHDRHAKVEQSVQDLEAEELRRAGRSEDEIRRYFADREAISERALERQFGYVGWLVTNAAFRTDRDRFRKQWGAKIRNSGRFPKYPVSYFGEMPEGVKKADRPFHDDYISLYQKWCLDTFASWELPVPMRCDLAVPSLYPLTSVRESGIVMFVPWYLMRQKDVTLRELADFESPPRHLQAWVDGIPKNWGPDRLSMILQVYVYFELALNQRYRQRLHGKSERVDLAFSRYFMSRKGNVENSDRMVESIRKTRQEMKRRLNR